MIEFQKDQDGQDQAKGVFEDLCVYECHSQQKIMYQLY